MTKVFFTLAAIVLYQIIPLLGAPLLLFHWKILAIITIAAALWLSQPTVRKHDVAAHHKTDRYTVLLILAMAGVSTIVPEVEWAYLRTDHSGNILWNTVGLGLMVGGTAYRIWAIHTLGKYFTTTVHADNAQVLITNGPYSHLRHPSYLGAIVAIVGCAVLLQAWIGVLVATAAMSYAYFQRIRAEEEALSTHFGEAYRSYQKRTWRMLPGVW